MDIKNIYYINGYIDENGTYEKKQDCFSIIAECKEDNISGISYYAFRSINSKTNEESNRDIIKLKNLNSLIDNEDVEVKRISSEEQLKRLKTYFTIIIENRKAANENNKDILKMI